MYNFLIIFSLLHNKFKLIHTDIDDCQPDPCRNNGTCTDLVNDYQCDCVAGFNETNCENSKHLSLSLKIWKTSFPNEVCFELS